MANSVLALECFSGWRALEQATSIAFKVQTPDLLILDEPLAGLDWKARADVVKLLKHLKKELTILAVSHDLKELAALVDRSWKMEMGGILREEPLPI